MAKTQQLYWRGEESECWREIDLSEIRKKDARITDVVMDPGNPRRLWLAAETSNVWRRHLDGEERISGIFTSHDGGTTWIDISDGLPRLPVNTIAYDAGHEKESGKLFIGLDIGVFTWQDETWQLVGEVGGGAEQLPAVAVQDLNIQHDHERGIRKLRAGTLGLGVWEFDLPLNSGQDSKREKVRN